MAIKSQYDIQLAALIEKHCVPYEYIGDLAEVVERRAVKVISEEIRENRFILWGAGESTKIITHSAKIDKSRISYIVDNNPILWGTEIAGIPVRSPEVLADEDSLSILISTLAPLNSQSIQRQILSSHPSASIYLVFTAGAVFPRSVEMEIFKTKYMHDHANDADEKRNYLELLISQYLHIKDFISAQRYISLHISLYHDTQNYIQLRDGLASLLHDLKSTLQKNNENHVFMMLYDTLGERHIGEHTPYLSKLKHTGIHYTKAYSPGVFTKESLKCIFLKQTYKQIEENDNKRTGITQLKSPLIEKLREHGFTPKLYSSPYVASFFSTTLTSDTNFSDIACAKTTSETFWQAVTQLCEEQGKQMKMLYFIRETHYPCIGASHSTHTRRFKFADYDDVTDSFFHAEFDSAEDGQDVFNMRRCEALTYADTQTEFYLSMLPKNTTTILFADHSRNLEGMFFNSNPARNLFHHSTSFHVPLIINANGIKPQQIDDIFSTAHLDDLIVSLIENGCPPVLANKVAEVGFPGFYNQKKLRDAKKAGFIETTGRFYAAIDSKYKLVNTGDENNLKYYAMDDEENEIHDKDLQQLIHNRLCQYIEGWGNLR